MPCKKCKSKSVTREEDTGRLVCLSCGEVQEIDNLEAQTLNSEGPVGVIVRVGTSGAGSTLCYRDKRAFETSKLIDEVCLKLNLTEPKPTQLKTMIHRITDGESGTGDWILVLVCACAYVIMRGSKRPMPIHEFASVAQCDVYELGRMIHRVRGFLNIEIPSIDLVESFERMLSKLSEFGRIENTHMARVREQGVFLLNCAIKWFLSTGRRPLPLMVAVVAFVLEMNGFPPISVEAISKDLAIAGTTCKARYKELLEHLVRVAKVLLPWGNDVNTKNVVKYGALILKHMEMKSISEKDNEEDEFHSFDLLLGCVNEDEDKNFWKYFHDSKAAESNEEGDDPISLKVMENLGGRDWGKVTEVGREKVSEKRRRFERYEMDWNGNSEMSKKMILEKILEANVGLETMPPSYVSGCEDLEKRKVKIKAAKERLEKFTGRGVVRKLEGFGDLLDGNMIKRRKKMKGGWDFDWEDFVIEKLLLHGVKEDQIESGHYKALLGLHVFDSGV